MSDVEFVSEAGLVARTGDSFVYYHAERMIRALAFQNVDPNHLDSLLSQFRRRLVVGC